MFLNNFKNWKSKHVRRDHFVLEKIKTRQNTKCKKSNFKETEIAWNFFKIRHYEEATKFEKLSHLFWQNSCFYSASSVKTSGRFFQTFVAFSEKLDFIYILACLKVMIMLGVCLIL